MTPQELADATWWAGLWSEIEHWAFLGVVVALGIEFAALKMGAPYKKILDDQKDLRIAELDNETAKLREQVEPRTLSREQQSNITESLKRFSGKSLHLSKYMADPESRRFAVQISKAVSDAGVKIRQLGIPLFPEISVIETLMILGVFVDGPPSQHDFISAVETALRVNGVEVIPTPNGAIAEGNPVHIVVGAKPFPR